MWSVFYLIFPQTHRSSQKGVQWVICIWGYFGERTDELVLKRLIQMRLVYVAGLSTSSSQTKRSSIISPRDFVDWTLVVSVPIIDSQLLKTPQIVKYSLYIRRLLPSTRPTIFQTMWKWDVCLFGSLSSTYLLRPFTGTEKLISNKNQQFKTEKCIHQGKIDKRQDGQIIVLKV